MRTFSKIYGLAGLRLGYGIGHPDLIAELEKIRQPFNINAVAQAGALAALDDTAHVGEDAADQLPAGSSSTRAPSASWAWSSFLPRRTSSWCGWARASGCSTKCRSWA